MNNMIIIVIFSFYVSRNLREYHYTLLSNRCHLEDAPSLVGLATTIE